MKSISRDVYLWAKDYKKDANSPPLEGCPQGRGGCMDERDKSPVPLLHSATKIPLPWRGARKGGVVAWTSGTNHLSPCYILLQKFPSPGGVPARAGWSHGRAGQITCPPVTFCYKNSPPLEGCPQGRGGRIPPQQTLKTQVAKRQKLHRR